MMYSRTLILCTMVLSRGFLSHNAQMHGLRYGCTIMQRFSTHNSIAATVRVRVDISGKQVNYKVKWGLEWFSETPSYGTSSSMITSGVDTCLQVSRRSTKFCSLLTVMDTVGMPGIVSKYTVVQSGSCVRGLGGPSIRTIVATATNRHVWPLESRQPPCQRAGQRPSRSFARLPRPD